MWLWPALDPERADADGLVAVGGDLRPRRLLEAYRRGVFPWYEEGGPILWWSPDPRGIIELDAFHVPRRLARRLRACHYRVTINQEFEPVIRGCAHRPDVGTWITPEMIDAYLALHQLGHAHSMEVWDGSVLAGGIYGVALGGVFCGESMFSARPEGSKAALIGLVEQLRRQGFVLFDIQMVTPHTARFGAREIFRVEYLRRLKQAISLDVRFV